MKIQLFLLACLIVPAAAAEPRVLPDIAPEEEVESLEEIERRRIEIERLFPENLVEEFALLAGYSHLDPQGKVPRPLLKKAVAYFDAHRASIPNRRYITVVDFSRRSNHARFFVVNMETGSVWALHTTHGKGGDLDHDGYVESLGNVPGSKKSSAGFYLVAETYQSQQFGRAIRLDGLSSTNSHVRARAIVMHGSNYAHEANVIQGRSEGCFALDWSVKEEVVNRLRGGSLMYAAKEY